MKKTISKIFLLALAGVLFSDTALAATNISFSATKIKVVKGQNFTLGLIVDPAGSPNYTVKVKLNFPADLVRIKSFTFEPGWFPLSQPGYDLIDNQKGILIKTAGYPGGFSDSTKFGTITFSAKKSGQGTISLADGSFVLDAENKNVLKNSISSVSLAITEKLAKLRQALRGK